MAGQMPTNAYELHVHSAGLFNERLAVLFYLLDMSSIEVNQSYNEGSIKKTNALLFQIWKNVRSLVRGNSVMRVELKLDTKHAGIYTLDIAFMQIRRMIAECEFKSGWTMRKAYIVGEQLNAVEVIIRDILQHHNYFMKPLFKTKPDILTASEEYKKNADALTLEELKGVMGARSRIDLEGIAVRQRNPMLALEVESDLDDDEPDDPEEYDYGGKSA